MGIFWPLEGVNPADPTDGGFGYLEWNSYPGYVGDAYHPAIDFNSGLTGDADCGKPVLCPEAGVVEAVTFHTSSYGLHVWVRTASGRWLHFCHLQAVAVKLGNPITRGALVGYCGKSAKGKANWPYCHLHFEVRRAKPPTWDYWPSWLPRERVAADYEDPLVYLAGLEGPLQITYGWTPYYTETNLADRKVLGICLHDTETDISVAPHSQGSWHYEIARDGTIYQYVDEADVAWHVRDCDRWWPTWLPHTQPYGPSAANCHTIGIELVSSANFRDPGDDLIDGGPYTMEQYDALEVLLQDIYRRRGPLPVVGHGQVQLDRSDPVSFLWWQAGLYGGPGDQGYVYTPLPDAATPVNEEEEVPMTVPADRVPEIKSYLEQFGVGMNPDTAIFHRAALAYVRLESRGPAISGEYDATTPDGVPSRRQKFSGGTVEWRSDTGETFWVEVNLEK